MEGATFELTTVCSSPPLSVELLVLFFFLWPLVTVTFLRRGRSPLPLLAMLLPFALAASVMWLGLARVIEVMAISGGGMRSTSAGIAEALIPPVLALLPALFVAIVALARRHRPRVDHSVRVFALAVATEVVAALLFTGWLAPQARQVTLALVWAGTALVLALAIAMRMVVLTRAREV